MTTSTDLYNDFSKKLITLNRVRSRAEILLATRKIQKRDLDYIYSGIFIKVTNHFECFLEDLYLSLLTQKIRHSSNSVHLFHKFPNKKLTIKIVKGGQPFIKWLPYENLKEMSKIHFKSDVPFRTLSPLDENTLKRISTVRNAIAHTSESSLKKLRSQVLNHTHLRGHERNAIGYLRSTYIITPKTLRYEEMINSLDTVAQNLS